MVPLYGLCLVQLRTHRYETWVDKQRLLWRFSKPGFAIVAYNNWSKSLNQVTLLWEKFSKIRHSMKKNFEKNPPPIYAIPHPRGGVMLGSRGRNLRTLHDPPKSKEDPVGWVVRRTEREGVARSCSAWKASEDHGRELKMVSKPFPNRQGKITMSFVHLFHLGHYRVPIRKAKKHRLTETIHPTYLFTQGMVKRPVRRTAQASVSCSTTKTFSASPPSHKQPTRYSNWHHLWHPFG